MSVNLGQIFVRVLDRKGLRAFLPEYLQRWVGARDLEKEDAKRFATGDSLRTLYSMPAVRGWTVLLEGAHRVVDSELAAAVSQRFNCRVIELEVCGCVFNYRWVRYENGVRMGGGELLNSAGGASEAMPRFQDAELLAWNEMLKWVPSELLFLMPGAALSVPPTAPANAERIVLTRVQAGVRLQGMDIAARIPAEQERPPVVFDVVVSKEALAAGMALTGKLVLEYRFLWGRPESAALEHLCTLLRRVRARYASSAGLPTDSVRFQVWSGKERILLPGDLGGSPKPGSSV